MHRIGRRSCHRCAYQRQHRTWRLPLVHHHQYHTPRHAMSASNASASTSEWSVYYWPGMIGRGEFARLLFAETNTAWTEEWQLDTTPLTDVFERQEALRKEHRHQFYAAPLVKHTVNGQSFLVSQTPVFTRYIARHADGGRLAPTTEQDEFRAQELVAMIVDVVAEGHDAWHAIEHNASYESQKEATQPFIDNFTSQRLPKYIGRIEAWLAQSGGEFFIGQALSYADLVVFHWLDGVKHQLPKLFDELLPIPLLRKFYQRIAERPNIAKRLKERKEKYDGTGPIF